jgi:hypothetical protein
MTGFDFGRNLAGRGVLQRLVRATLCVAAAAILIAGAQGPARAICGAWGGGWNHDTEAGARAAAMRQCKGKNCKVAATLAGNCIAFAIDRNRSCGAWGWATRQTREAAEEAALNQCRKHKGANCNIRAQFCDSQNFTAPSLSSNWKSIELSQTDCMARGERLAKEAGLKSNFNIAGHSIFGESGDYTGWVRCIAEKGIVVIVITGPKLEDARKFQQAIYNGF